MADVQLKIEGVSVKISSLPHFLLEKVLRDPSPLNFKKIATLLPRLGESCGF